MIKQITVKDFHIFPDRRSLTVGDNDVSEKFLTMLNGDDWRRVRNVLTPTFTSGKMRKMFNSMNNTVKEAAEALLEITSNGSEINLKDFAAKYTLSVIASCCFAINANSYKNPNSEFFKQSTKFFDFSFGRIFLVLLLPNWFRRWINLRLFATGPTKYYEKVIRHVISERRSKNIKVDDFLQLLLDASDGQAQSATNEGSADSNHNLFSQDEDEVKSTKLSLDGKRSKNILDELEMVANSISFLAAGYETTATLITFALYELARHPSMQEKLRTEMNKYDEINYDSVSNCVYLDATIQEVLRFHSPVAGFDRQAVEDYHIEGTNITIENGYGVMIDVYSLHFNSENYENPDVFNPDRFLPENRHNIKPYTFLPFGSGPRNCIGMRFALLEAKLLISKLIVSYSFHFIAKTDDPPKYKIMSPMITHEPLYVGVKKLSM